MNEDKNKIINIILGIVIIILIIIIILLLFFRKGNEILKPSGNIDIFEITCTNNCDSNKADKNDENDDDKDEKVEDNDNKENNKQNQQAQIENEIKENFSVLNKNGVTWDSTKELNIFSNPMFEMKERIAPESSNIYQFIVRNNTIYNLNYDLSFIEENDMNIDMKYRLKKNDKYVVGSEEEWVKYTELNLNKISSKSKTSDTYYLEWKWFSGENDTAIGEAGDVEYALNINIKAEQDI